MKDEFRAFRLYGSAKSRARVEVAAALVLVAGLLAGSTHTVAAGVSVATALLLLARQIRDPEVECAFCRRSRRLVDQMVAGPSASICDACTPLSMAILNEEALKNSKTPWLASIKALPGRCPRAISGPLLRSLDPLEPAVRDALIEEGFRLSNEPAIIEQLELVPAASRRPADWVNLNVSLEREERYAEALAALEPISGDPTQEPWVLNNRASSRLEMGEVDAAELKKLLEDNERARRLVLDGDREGTHFVKAAMLGCAAELHRRLGDSSRARGCLEEADALWPADPDRLLTSARLTLADRKEEEARRVLQKALDLAHPESRVAVRLTRLLSELSEARS